MLRLLPNIFAHSPALSAQDPAPLNSIQTIVLLNLYRNPQNTPQTADGSHWRDHFLGAGRTALCRPLPDSTLSPPGHVREVEVQEHYDNVFEVRIGRDGLSCGPGVQLNTSWSPQEVIMELQEKYGEIEEMNVSQLGGPPRGQCLCVNVPAFPPLETRGGGISVLKGHHLSLIV